MSYRSHSGGKTPRSNTLPLICEAASFSLAHRGLDLVTPSVSPSLEVPHIDIPSTKITPNALASLSSSSSSATQDHAVKSRECHHSSLHRQCVECVKKELVKTRASSVLNCLKDIFLLFSFSFFLFSSGFLPFFRLIVRLKSSFSSI